MRHLSEEQESQELGNIQRKDVNLRKEDDEGYYFNRIG
jgi:hypothetical protein